ncbi:response regulator [Litoribacillus peritrichatus]|uniref:histidine kinase n=1 Tax=Litoribacillus peritrichatus TaxID=718191 RepID=A0ABP7MDY6_9GAMM
MNNTSYHLLTTPGSHILDKFIPQELLNNVTSRFQARTLIFIVGLFGVTGIIALTVVIFLEDALPARRIVTLMLVAAQPIALVVMHLTKKITLAARSSILLIWLVTFYIDFNNQSVSGPVSILWLLPSAYAALLLNRKDVVFTTVASFIGYGINFTALEHNLLPPPITNPEFWESVKFITMTFTITVITACIYALTKLRDGREHDLSTEINLRQTIMAELAQAKDKAESSAKSKAMFLATMSHELRTPLNGVLASAELLSLDPLPEKSRARVNDITSAGSLLLTLINDILDLSKFDSQGIQLAPKAYSLNNQLNNIHRLMASKVKPGVELKLDIPQEDTFIIADEHRMSQIILNLLSNSLKFTERGHVILQASLKDTKKSERKSLTIKVTDTGLGISKEDQEDLFVEFSQVGDCHRIHREGTGLGLTITQKIVQKMEGTISLDSQPKMGTQVTVELPVILSDCLDTPPEPTSHQPINDISDLKVIIVDDIELNRLVLKAMLEELGVHHIDEFDNGLKVFEYVEQHPDIDIIFMDVCMPVMDGIEASRNLRNIDFKKPIIAVTANAYSEDQEQCLEAGMTGFVAKPVLIGPLRTCLEEIIEAG